MNVQEERKLLVFTYMEQNGINSLDSLRSELKLKDDPDFDFDNTVDVLVKNQCLEKLDDLTWKITEFGNKKFSDLKTEKYEDLNKMPVIIQFVLIVIAILAFMKIFPKMFPNF
jgi:hypothetical protein